MLETQQNEHEALNLNKDNIINQNFDSKQQQTETVETDIQNENSQKDCIFNKIYFETKPKLNENNLFTKNDTCQNQLFANDFNTPSPTNKNKHEINLVDVFQVGDQKEKENKQIDDTNHLTNDGIEQNKEELNNSEKNIPTKQRNFSEQLLIQSHQENDIVLNIQKDEMQNSQLSSCSAGAFKGIQNEQQIKILDSQIQQISLDKSEDMNNSKKILKIQMNIKKRYCFRRLKRNFKQQQIQKGFSNLKQISALRTPQACSSVQNCEVCEYDVCLKCKDGRVLPQCSCPLGYVEVNGECNKCPSNCESCQDSSTCLTCYQQYTLNNGCV
ncbi:hypothetical protein ABPG72_014120 [Tetrahymena utriculariae]